MSEIVGQTASLVFVRQLVWVKEKIPNSKPNEYCSGESMVSLGHYSSIISLSKTGLHRYKQIICVGNPTINISN